MNYSIFKLKFDTAVHFGSSDTAQSLSSSEMTVHADTLFSALCHTAVQMYGRNYLQELYDCVSDGRLVLSDTMPWRKDEFYLPKPFIISHSDKELPTEWTKAMKKLNWIPLSSFSAFSNSVNGGEPYNPMEYSADFGIKATTTRAQYHEFGDAVPYTVGSFCFASDCGLYAIVGCENDEMSEKMARLFKYLGLSGIGGKISSGLGKFHVEEVINICECENESINWLYNALTTEAKHSLLLSTSLPKDDELKAAIDGAFYQVIRRGGFVSSDKFSKTPVKKKTQYFMRAGSLLSNRFEGDLYLVASNGAHPVYRYSKPLFLGVDI